MEAKIDDFQEKCTCKPFYYPGNIPFCDRTGMNCIHETNSITSLKSLTDTFFKVFCVDLNGTTDCLPLCTEVSYETSISTADFPGSENIVNNTKLKELYQKIPKMMTYEYFL